jgi:hypothetical protein
MATLEVARLTASEADVLAHAASLYLSAPAHGMPQIINRETDERSHCVISACATAGFALGADKMIGPACRRVAKIAGVSVARLPEWEAAADTDEVRDAFRAAQERAL